MTKPELIVMYVLMSPLIFACGFVGLMGYLIFGDD